MDALEASEMPKRSDGASPRESLSHILHVDMDAFFLSVELLQRPELVGTSCFVAFDAPRSVVLSASYEARSRGIRSAMPLARAKALDPTAILVEPRHGVYGKYSKRIMEIFSEYSAQVEQLSIDEAFLDVSGAVRLFGSPVEIAREIRVRIKDELKLTASVGVARNKFVAKVASTRSKPNGLYHVPPEQTEEFLRPLPVSALWGVGSSTQAVLQAHGIHIVADVADAEEHILTSLLGQHGAALKNLARGIDPRPVSSYRVEKSLSADRTFETDLDDRAQISRELLDVAHRVAIRLRKASLCAQGVSLRVRWKDFSQTQRSRQMSHPSDSAAEIFRVASELLEGIVDKDLKAKVGVRLLSLRVDHLVPGERGHQFDLLGHSQSRREAEGAMDLVKERFGSSSITVAGLLSSRTQEGQSARKRKG